MEPTPPAGPSSGRPNITTGSSPPRPTAGDQLVEEVGAASPAMGNSEEPAAGKDWQPPGHVEPEPEVAPLLVPPGAVRA